MTTQIPPRILIVEDDFIIAADLATQVERLGYTVAGSVATGAEAVAAVREQLPAVVLMDINLHGAMDGVEAAGLIWQTCHVPVIFLTGNPDTDSAERNRPSGAVGVITKPFTRDDLRDQIARAISGAPASA